MKTAVGDFFNDILYKLYFTWKLFMICGWKQMLRNNAYIIQGYCFFCRIVWLYIIMLYIICLAIITFNLLFYINTMFSSTGYIYIDIFYLLYSKTDIIYHVKKKVFSKVLAIAVE